MIILISSFTIVSCSSGEKTSTPSTQTVIDQINRTVTIKSVPQRIVSLAPSNTEILYALGLGERVVAVTDYDSYPPEVKEKPSIGGFSTPNIEEVVAMNPDLVIAVGSIHKDQIIPQLEAKGLTVLALNPETLDQVLAAIKMVGEVCGVANTANEVVTGMQERIQVITDKTDRLTPEQRPRALYLVWHDPVMAAGSGTLYDEFIMKGGGTNIASDLDGYADISLEAVISADPQIIIASVGMGTGEDLTYQFVLDEARLQVTSARQNNNVFSIDVNLVSHPGPRSVDALEMFAKFIHPELFGEP
jgi:iron complex transport system substrate-binding protein